ncbi:unnamed protein product [Aphanomyces euteiches]|uniref:Uncharacterized protein n=1 Tax=Aphanomyces euteiches TaxID=100861 RepID=A0A6G0XJI4_9STRA|nr:hypothetical protein Ae201684_004121 [Aphanomyces euteiches]KAH9093489.1 hypothetical protein Ae201684P_016117 [Aphanomyces euteiches]KAH9143336.1 hypothetical protein AeRB84_012653 [Aphanomyces euteiches]
MGIQPGAMMKKGIVLFDAEDYARMTGKRISWKAKKVAAAMDIKPRVSASSAARRCCLETVMRRRSSLYILRQVVAEASYLDTLRSRPDDDIDRPSLTETVLMTERIPILEEFDSETTKAPKRKSKYAMRLKKFWRNLLGNKRRNTTTTM